MHKLNKITGPKFSLDNPIMRKGSISLEVNTNNDNNQINLFENQKDRTNEINFTKELKLPVLESIKSTKSKRSDKKIFSKKSQNISSIKSKLQNEKKSPPNFFSVIKRAKLLIKKVKRNLYFKNYENMTNYQKEILNDKSLYIERDEKNNKVSFFFFININILLEKFNF